jgi:DNA-binding response OmpR family regulator
VLLVEDDPASAKAMDGILRAYAMDVVIASTVQEALEALRKHSFQFLVLDLMLPDGDGTIVLREVRERKLDTWVCVVTAATDPVLLESVQRMQPQRVLRKPIDMGQLLGGLNLAQ